ncbi:type II secretion system protein M [Paucibacter sp. DJ1R-11]|uniref:type II secretion system protein M n=1 Tax=unclassified Roseateles TaxID=2626991 RepID=UPI0021E48AB3|nr:MULTISPECIES: type II secretion system protein M [unclassified Roseateles]MCV2365435.1 type II secretion system protein M [Paucibacter sp. DJ1R-11]MCV2421925.1 type II secretion system protein M [Paucibacter sp. DJ4R-1]MCV2439458.1 type II secretion system protein M [Paucibacter sp. DJ2R-2]
MSIDKKPTPWAGLQAQAQAQWQQMGERERKAAQLIALLLGLALLWFVAIQPAWRTLSQAPAQAESLERQLQDMQALAQEAQTLRAAPAVPAAQAAQALQAASEHLGPAARLQLSGDRAVLTLNGVSSEALQAWLGEARSAARARPLEAKLQRGPQGFSGSIVLGLQGGSAP